MTLHRRFFADVLSLQKMTTRREEKKRFVELAKEIEQNRHVCVCM